MFIGRNFELAELNRLYDTDTFQFAVIYGLQILAPFIFGAEPLD